MFQPSQKVVYPGHGVAQIEAIIEREVVGMTVSFFKLRFLYKDMTVLVPVQKDNTSMHIRPLSALQEVDRAFAELHKTPKKLESSDFTPSSWNKRNKGYQLKIQRGDLVEIAGIYRDLMHTGRYKDLSFGEKNLLQSAEELLLQEIHVVRGEDRESIMQELRAPFKQLIYAGVMTMTSGNPVIV